MSVATSTCPECGSALRSRTSRGLCPQCVLRVALHEGESATGEEWTSRGFGPYELVRELGRGGMGVVYEARQVAVNRRVALKMILPAHLASATDVERFRLEAKAVALLDHPNILPIYDVGEINGQAYFTMKLVEGGSLAELAADRFREPRDGARLVAQVAHAVHYAHQRGIQHRDLKPGNILIDAEGRPYLGDFGLARFFEGDSRLTLSSSVLGSPAYMAPEQALGDMKNVTTAADIYSLGAILYELLSGKPPFHGHTVYDTMRQVAEHEAPPPSASRPGLDRDLEIICLRCLSKDPQQRYHSAESLAEDLERWLAGEPILARPASTLEKFWRWRRRNPTLAAVSAACLLAVILGGAGVTVLWRRAARLAVAAMESARQTQLNLYAADMSVAAQALKRGNLGLARLTLTSHQPQPGQEDLRGFEWRYLFEQSRGGQAATLEGHSWIVTCVAYSPDGALVASGSLDGTARIWDATNHALVRTLAEGAISISSLAFTPDGGELMTGAARGTVDFWNVRTGEKAASFAGRLAALSPDGRMLATADASPFWWEKAGQVKLWGRAGGRLIGALPGMARRPVFSRDGALVAAPGQAHDVLVWETATLKLRHRLPTAGPMWSVVFSPSNDVLVATGWTNEALVWNLAGGGAPVPVELKGHELGLWSAAFSHDGATLATTSSDQTVRLWNAATMEVQSVLRGHGSEVWCVAFSPDDQWLATGSKDRTVMLWNRAMSTPPVAVKNMSWHPPQFSPNGRRLLTETGEGDGWQGELWDVASQKRLAVFPGPVEMAGFAPDGEEVIGLPPGREVLDLWSVNPPAIKRTVPLEGQAGRALMKYGFSPDYARLFGIEADGAVQLWDARTGRRVGGANGPKVKLRNAVLSRSGNLLATSSEAENGVHLLDLRTGHDTFLGGHDDFVSGLAFSPDETMLATGSVDGTLRLWEIAKAREIARLTGHMEEVTDVCFSPDGRTLASLEQSIMLKLWHVPTRRELMSLEVPKAFGWLRFSPDGETLAINQSDHTLRFLRAPGLERRGQSVVSAWK